jgi:hypothetical protein
MLASNRAAEIASILVVDDLEHDALIALLSTSNAG